MPTYNYICPQCSHTYSESRTAEEPQYITKCNGCKSAEYVEVQ